MCRPAGSGNRLSPRCGLRHPAFIAPHAAPRRARIIEESLFAFARCAPQLVRYGAAHRRWNISDKNISDEAVREATGRGWRGWWKVLDSWGAPKHSHSEIARFLAHEHGLSGWWSQTVSVQYERERGLRELGETPSGFQMGAQKTFLPDVDAAWNLISSPEGIETWLGPGAPSELVAGEGYRLLDGTTGEIRVVASGSHVRLTWQPPPWSKPSTLQVRAVASPSGRGTVSFHHEGLPDQAAREAMVAHWKDRLGALREAWNARDT